MPTNSRASKLHQKVMNLPCPREASTAFSFNSGFVEGHKTARHDAAELILTDERLKAVDELVRVTRQLPTPDPRDNGTMLVSVHDLRSVHEAARKVMG